MALFFNQREVHMLKRLPHKPRSDQVRVENRVLGDLTRELKHSSGYCENQFRQVALPAQLFLVGSFFSHQYVRFVIKQLVLFAKVLPFKCSLSGLFVSLRWFFTIRLLVLCLLLPLLDSALLFLQVVAEVPGSAEGDSMLLVAS